MHNELNFTAYFSRLLPHRGKARPDGVVCGGLLNSLPDGAAVVTNDGIILFANPAFCELLHLKEGGSIQTCFCEEIWNSWKSSIAEEKPVEKQPAAVKDKELLVSLAPFNEYGKNGFLLYCNDITLFKENEKKLMAARTAAEASVKAKSEFLANMSHEIRTPMNAVLGMAHLVLRTELTNKQREYIEGAEQSAKLLLRIINDILDFSKIEAGRLIMEYREFVLRDIANEVGELFAEAAQKKNIELRFETALDVPQNVMGDSVRLRQVIVNLISNAVKFTNGGGKVSLNIETVEQDGLSALLRFTVQDTGIGMLEEQIKCLFTPFSQADASTTRRFGGTGLGLAISKQIVKLMKGEIDCHSAEGQGTTFVFTARFGLPLEGEITEVTQEVKPEALILGDRPATVQQVKNSLELLSCRVAAACLSSIELKVFLQSVRCKSIDFVLFIFDDSPPAIGTAYNLLSEHFGCNVPPLVISSNKTGDALRDEMKINVPFQQVRYPFDLTELFNVLTQITVEKKRRVSEEQKQAAVSKTTYQIPASLHGAKILLAEDNRINQIVATELLQLEGFSVDVADNGQIAVEMSAKKDYDVILMDIQMPVMDGLEAARKIRQREQNVPILALSADAMSGDAEKSLAAGMNAHITKPIDPPQLFNALIHWIKR